jgi:putative hydrolase of the HAD superfamily
MDVKTIVFDFGNVIGYFDHRRAARNLAAHSDLSADAILGHLSDAVLEDEYESGRISSAEFLRRLRAMLRATSSDEALGIAFADMFTANDDVCSLVPLLKGTYRLLVGSNTTELHAVQFKQQFADTLSHFDALVLSYEIGARKPQPAFFEHCQRLAGSSPQECLFIDDLPANVAGARACGWHGIVYDKSADLRRQLAALGIRADGG